MYLYTSTDTYMCKHCIPIYNMYTYIHISAYTHAYIQSYEHSLIYNLIFPETGEEAFLKTYARASNAASQQRAESINVALPR